MPATLYSSTELGKLQLSDPTVSLRGTRSCSVTTEAGKPVVLRHPELRAPFGATSFDDPQGATRRNLDLTDAPPELLRWLEQLDAWAISAAVKNSEKLFKSKKTEGAGEVDVHLAHQAWEGRLLAYDSGQDEPGRLGTRAVLGEER